jgi:hypothetical protein
VEAVEIKEQCKEIIQTRKPTQEDVQFSGRKFLSGQKWVNAVTGEVWILFTQIKKNILLQYWVCIKKADK